MITEHPATAIPPVHEATPLAAKAAEPRKSARLLSLDAYRGFVMLLMISAGLGITKVAASFPGDWLWSAAAYQTDHAAWRGCSLWDLIQPSFMFIVGVAMSFSYAKRQDEGQSWWGQWGHALLRAALLCLIGWILYRVLTPVP